MRTKAEHKTCINSPVQPSAPRTVEYDEAEESQEQVAHETTKRGRRPNAAKAATPQNPSKKPRY